MGHPGTEQTRVAQTKNLPARSRRTHTVPPRTRPAGRWGYDYDVLVVGSGFGGSVAALRLTEKGYRVGVVEAGRRFADDEFAASSWRLRSFLWAPALGCFGIQRVRLLRDVLVLAGAGVGGGSLVYANTLYRPLEPFFADPAWAHLTDWKAELDPYYDQAERMLGSVHFPGHTPADDVVRQVAEQMGAGSTFRHANVGVFFGADGTVEPGRTVPDPFFGGVGPARTGCTQCGECMTGCRHGAKNTLVKNYLYLAERAGAQVHPLTTVTAVAPLAGRDGFTVETRHTGRPGRGRRFTARQVVLAAGTLGTQTLLHAMRDTGRLPHLSERLGHLTRTNSEALLGAMVPRRGPLTTGGRRDRTRRAPDYSRGVAITSSFYPDPATHIEPVRYGHRSNAMGLLQTVLVDGTGPGEGPRWRRWLGELWRQRRVLRDIVDLRRWSERTVIALVMQARDNSLTTFTRRGPLGRRLTSRQGTGEPNPAWIPQAHDAVRRMAAVMGGHPGGSVGDPFDVPMTAHIIGGCTIGATPADGVVDPYHRVHGYAGLHVVDGSSVTANLGVNPSLTITAQAERAFAMWPNRGDADPRPPQGTGYVRVSPVRPVAPVVPPTAPAALRLPVVEIRHTPR
ncbi:GMC family oxidoreductase [Xylanimonas allomyrinae]|uniref:Cholesterol oxidase n=1 Tax=Xylanimonas allomyrinae TaxID=2509459 RepID=A0A4P6EK24_9MICO|nr:GMC family oxidoreductase [Xylanimonas allomyrinae]QAY62934.1 GMC family oxidoreductase [Xylanimonas allomyrinae]